MVFLALTSLLARADLTIGPGVTVSLPPGGSLDLGCTKLDVQGSYLISTGSVSQVTNVDIGAAGQLQGGAGTIALSGNWNNAGGFVPGSGSIVFNDNCGAGPILISGNTSFHNLTLSSAVGRTFVIAAGASITVSGTLTLLGAPGLPIQLAAAPGQNALIGLAPGAQVVSSNAAVPASVRIASLAQTAIPSLDDVGLVLLSLLLALFAIHPLGFNKKFHGDIHEPI